MRGLVIRVLVAAAVGGAARGALAQTPEPGTASSAGDGLTELASLYGATRFEDCVATARRLLDTTNPEHLTARTDVDTATKYLGTCLLRTDRGEEATALFEEWIYAGAKRNAVPSRPYVAQFGAEVADTYDVAYGRVDARLNRERQAELAKVEDERDDQERVIAAEAKRQAALLKLAEEQVVVTQNRRWLASVPFGVGQFQNGDRGLGWLFLVSEAVTLGVTVGGVLTEIELATLADSPRVDGVRLNQSLDRARLTWTVSSYAFAAIVAAGVVQAHAAYVPEFRRVERRVVPDALRKPAVPPPKARVGVGAIPVPGGAGLGVVGRF